MSQSDIMDLPNMIQANFSAETQKLQDRGLDSGVLSVFLTYLKTAVYSDKPHWPMNQTCPDIHYVMVPVEYYAALREFGILDGTSGTIAADATEVASPGPSPMRRLLENYRRRGDDERYGEAIRDLAHSLEENVGMYYLATEHQVGHLKQIARHRFCRTTLDMLIEAQKIKNLRQRDDITNEIYTAVANAIRLVYSSTKPTDPLRRAACVLIGDLFLAHDGVVTVHETIDTLVRTHGDLGRGIEDFKAQPQLRAWRELMDVIHA